MVINRQRLILFSSLFLAACSSPLSIDYQQDSAPMIPQDVSAVNNAIPAPVHRTRAGNKSPYTVLGKTYRVLPESRGYKARGIASWYGQKFHGRRTSNGEVYDMYAMTAAHTSLPIPSYVRVTNLDNGRSIIVRVNDRGPFYGGRIIDLSYAGAVKLGFVNQGTARVEVEDVTPAATTSVSYLRSSPLLPTTPQQQTITGRYLQLGAFSTVLSAQSLSDQLASLFAWPVKIIRGADQLHRVLIGPLDHSLVASEIQQMLIDSGISSGYIINLP